MRGRQGSGRRTSLPDRQVQASLGVLSSDDAGSATARVRYDWGGVGPCPGRSRPGVVSAGGHRQLGFICGAANVRPNRFAVAMMNGTKGSACWRRGLRHALSEHLPQTVLDGLMDEVTHAGAAPGTYKTRYLQPNDTIYHKRQPKNT